MSSRLGLALSGGRPAYGGGPHRLGSVVFDRAPAVESLTLYDGPCGGTYDPARLDEIEDELGLDKSHPLPGAPWFDPGAS